MVRIFQTVNKVLIAVQLSAGCVDVWTVTFYIYNSCNLYACYDRIVKI